MEHWATDENGEVRIIEINDPEGFQWCWCIGAGALVLAIMIHGGGGGSRVGGAAGDVGDDVEAAEAAVGAGLH